MKQGGERLQALALGRETGLDQSEDERAIL